MKKLIFGFMLYTLFFSCGKENPVVAEPVISFTLTVTSGVGGGVSSSGGSYTQGKSVSITATPDPEYIFVNWSNGSTDNPLSVTVNSNQTVTANFEKRKYPLTISITGSGTVSEEIISSGKSTTEYNSGSVIRLTANPSDEWVFMGWSGSVSSTENPLEITVDQSKILTAIFQPPEVVFSNRSPLYPNVNNSIGNIKTNYYHPGLILTPDIIENFIDLRENCDCTGCACTVNYNLYNNHSRYIDFNNDGKIDLFGWLMNNSGGYGVGYGKYVVVDDVFNNPISTYYDSNIWFGGRMEVNDYNGDGVDDILVYNQNDHGDNQGGHFTDRTPLEIIYFNFDGSFNVVQVGGPTGSHELATFDIDSDGDVDIVNFEYYMGPDGTENNTSVQVPLFYINDGNGNFEIVKTNFLEHEYYLNTVQIDFNFISVDGFDLDNDGYIDMIVGNSTEKVDDYCVYDNPNDPFEQNCYSLNSTEGIRIFWGNANSTFSENDMTVFDRSYFSNGSEKGPLGFNFIDVNNDGNYEVVSTGFHDNIGDYGPYSGGFIDIYSNDGNRRFSRMTDNIMDNYEWFYKNKRSIETGDIPLFYDIGVVDVDNDGDFDLIPHTINTGSVRLLNSNEGVDTFRYESNIGKNFFWRNDGGFFTLINDRMNYQN
ncbi:MAG: VCBS repeat-containing protein [Flavobacteriaceae bacterium]|nr:VCBS repeat-containing protein [Flavobacteriaceae bacterium]